MQKIAAYFRVSSDEQRDKQTIQNQIDFAHKYVDLHGLSICDEYKDDGVTGTLPLELRPEGARMLSDAKEGKFDTLLLYKLDRLGRSARIVINAIHELESLGVTIKSMTEPFDTQSPSGRLHVNMLASFADFERSTFLERSAIGTTRAAREGRWLGGIVPYGYRVNAEKYLEINEDPIEGFNVSEADIVRKIFSLVANDGFTTEKIADYLNARGYPPRYTIDGRKIPKGKRKQNTSGFWRPGRVRNMIVNETYKGLHAYGKRSTKQREVIYRDVPSIVSEELWERASNQLRKNRIDATRNSKRQYLLRGLIKCGACGLTYCGTAYAGTNREPKAFYVCNGKNDKYKGSFIGKCKSKNLPAVWIEDLVWNDCENFLRNPGSALGVFIKSFSEEQIDLEQLASDKSELLKDISRINSERERIMTFYRKDLITEAEAQTQLEAHAREKSVLQLQVQDVDAKIETANSEASRYADAMQYLLYLQSKLSDDVNFETKREIVTSLVKQILVFTVNEENSKPKAQLSIHYMFEKVAPRTGKGSSPPQG